MSAEPRTRQLTLRNNELDTSDCFIDIPDTLRLRDRDVLWIKHMIERQIAQKARLPTLELPQVQLMRIHSPELGCWRYISRPPQMITLPKHTVVF